METKRHNAPSPVHRIEIDPRQARIRNLRYSTLTGARLLDEQTRRGGFRTYPVMITLTYAEVDRWSRYHVTTFLHRVRDTFKRWKQPLHYCWVAELQSRGAVHYHIVVWMPHGRRLPKPDRAGWWPHGSSKIEGARNPVGYLAKYVSKGSLEGIKFPKGIRLHGRGGLDRSSRSEARYWSSPKWVRDALGAVQDIRRCPGGFVVTETGEFLPSPWRVMLEGGKIYIWRPG